MEPFVFPNFDPVIFQIGPLAIRWYALAYIVGLVGAWRYGIWLARREPNLVTAQHVDDFLVWATVGVILGGRLGYVFFYQPAYFLAHPLEIPQMWNGGMSFHGGLVGVITAMILFARRRGIALFALADVIAATAPIGLLLGRIANFINGELWGRETDVPWGVIFPHAGPNPRHPSQLYEAFLEGFVLLIVLSCLVLVWRSRWRVGLTSGAFLIGYSLSRMAVETVRQPDDYIGLLVFDSTWGQWLSIPMLLFGVYMIGRALVRPPVAAT
jgi:phosphatidylglycerol:prolipoprotein diacylglycerol transferase